VRNGLSRFARWASLRQVEPRAVDTGAIARFIAELEEATLIRNLDSQRRSVATAWNLLVRLRPDARLQTVAVPTSRLAPTRVNWAQLPELFRADIERYLAWCAVPDPLDEDARANALAPRTLQLRRDHIHSAVTAVTAARDRRRLLDVAPSLVEPETFKALLRHLGRRVVARSPPILMALPARWSHRQGMGEAAGGSRSSAQCASPQTRDAALRSDRQEQGAGA
jgi:hypothetical protein